MGDDAAGVEEGDHAQTVATGARAGRVVEREQARLQFGHAVAAHRAGEAGGKQLLRAVVHVQRDGAAFCLLQRRFQRFGQTLAHVGAHLQAVDDDVDRVLDVLVQLRQRVDIHHLAVEAHAHEAARAQLGNQLDLFALALAHDRREDGHLAFFRHGEHRVHHLRHALRRQRFAVLGAVRRAYAGEQQAQVVVDFSHRAHGGARIVAGRLLFDGNRRRQALDEVHVRFFHELQELARVGRQRFHVAALAFGVQRVEGE